MRSLPACSRIWLVAGITYMLNGFNGLASKVQNVLKDDPFSGHLFIFRGRRGDQIKVLWADSDEISPGMFAYLAGCRYHLYAKWL